ncbi:amidohydrolase [Ramlibacter sp.]|uniref:amidohydrolase n=1 Tax=Ramlibacter sp. TaxID=1917967 RepID=UPI003D1169C6
MVDLILHNGIVHTVDADDSVAEAIAVSAGRIVAVGESGPILALRGPGTRVVDLRGKTVVPGFVDAHPHVDMVGVRLIKPSFGNPSRIEQVIDVLRGEAAKRPAGEWILCNPVATEPDMLEYPGRLAEKRWPDRRDLDLACPDHPVYIEPPSLSSPGAAIMNTLALRANGITRDSVMPENVEMVVDAEGEPTGLFLDSGFPKKIALVDGAFKSSALFPAIPPLSREDIARTVVEGVKAFNRAGTTMSYEGHGLAPGTQRAYLDVWQRKELTIRTYFVMQFPFALYGDAQKAQELIDHTARYAGGAGFGDDLLKFGGLGLGFDSAAAIGACCMREPYNGPKGQLWNGVQLVRDVAYEDIVRRCARAGVRVQTLCAGGAAIDKVMATYKSVNEEIPIRGLRWTIQHCQFPSAENMRDCRELGVIPTTSANFLWLYGSVYLRAFGEKIAADSMPFRAWLDAGVPVAQSSDARPHEALFGFWQMLARRDAITGRELATPAQSLTRQQALRCCTLHGAMAAFWDHAAGSIEVGKFADLAILSDDIMTVDLDRIPQTQVLATLLGGVPVHDTGLFH